MGCDLIVRQGNNNDSSSVLGLLKLIAKLHKDGRPDVFANLESKYNYDEVYARLSKEENGVFVAEQNGAVVGYIFCDIIKEGDGNTLYIDDLCVSPDARRMGVGRALMDFAAAYGKEKECRFLMLNVWEFNRNALDFYENYGFKTRSRHLEMPL